MGKRCKQLAAASLHRDPRRAFTQSTDNAERFLASQEFVNSAVKSLIKSLYTNSKVDKDRIVAIMSNQDTIEDIKRSIDKTPECCNLPAFIQSCGVKNPDLHIEKMIKASVAGITTHLKDYSKTKKTLTASRVGSYFQKFQLPVDVRHLLKDVDTKNKYVPISRRATVLPPIRPPVSRPTTVKLSRTPVAAAAPRKISPQLVEIDEVPMLRSVEETDESDLVEMDDIPQLVSAKVNVVKSSVTKSNSPRPVVTVGAQKKDTKYILALALLEKSLDGPLLDEILAKQAVKFTYFCPNNEVLKKLEAELEEVNSNIAAVADLIVRSHLMIDTASGQYENLDGTKFKLADKGMVLQDIKSGRRYAILHREPTKENDKLRAEIRHMVIGELIEKAEKKQ